MMRRYLAVIASLALVLSLNAWGPMAADAAPGRWFLTGPMVVGRWVHTLTALDDGRALAAGGFAPGATTNTAELYDPVSRTWSATGSMGTARAYHTATKLLDGRILIAGGSVPYPAYTSTAEIYDPATGTFSPTGSMTRARTGHTATLLLNGKVLIAGNTGDGSEATAELYDPVSGTFTATGSMNFGRNTHVAVALHDGQVLVAGGTAGHDGRATELYDPVSGTWSLTGDINLARDWFAGVLLPLVPGDPMVPAGGKVLVAGGRIEGGGATNRAELYDRATGTWTEAPPMNVARWAFDMALDSDLGYVPAAGGTNDGTATSLSAAELYHGGAWSNMGPLNEARAYHRMVHLEGKNGQSALVAGGYDYGAGAPAQSGEVNEAPPPPLPTSKDQCKNGGWQSFGVFKNQGDCVSFVATKGKNPPTGP